MKIQIIGYSGSGKSTLAKLLAEHFNLPLLYLDHVQFYDDWKIRNNCEQQQIVKDFLDSNSSWVIDGNYSKIQPQRFQECDTIIFLNYNRIFCLVSCIQRYFQYKGTPRESCPCNEKMDLEFIRWILYEGRTKKARRKHLENLSKCQGTKLVFKNRKLLTQYLKSQGILK